MTSSPRDDALVTLAFSLYSNPGAYAILVGAGVSKDAVPTAWEVLTSLIVDVASLTGETITADDAENWWAENLGTEPRYENILEKLAPTQHERQRLLRRFLNESLIQTTPAHSLRSNRRTRIGR